MKVLGPLRRFLSDNMNFFLAAVLTPRVLHPRNFPVSLVRNNVGVITISRLPGFIGRFLETFLRRHFTLERVSTYPHCDCDNRDRDNYAWRRSSLYSDRKVVFSTDCTRSDASRQIRTKE